MGVGSGDGGQPRPRTPSSPFVIALCGRQEARPSRGRWIGPCGRVMWPPHGGWTTPMPPSLLNIEAIIAWHPGHPRQSRHHLRPLLPLRLLQCTAPTAIPFHPNACLSISSVATCCPCGHFPPPC